MPSTKRPSAPMALIVKGWYSPQPWKRGPAKKAANTNCPGCAPKGRAKGCSVTSTLDGESCSTPRTT